MATDSSTRAVTNTLSTTVADTVTITDVEEYVEIVNHDATTTLYFSHVWDQGVGSAATPTTAVSAADDTIAVLAAQSVVLPARGHKFVASIVGNGNVYSVQTY